MHSELAELGEVQKSVAGKIGVMPRPPGPGDLGSDAFQGWKKARNTSLSRARAQEAAAPTGGGSRLKPYRFTDPKRPNARTGPVDRTPVDTFQGGYRRAGLD